MRGLLAALGFLTRIPVPARVCADADAQRRSLAWYPLVGASIGALLCALALALQGAPPFLRAVLLVAAWVALTGALHLDGLADSADAWVGGLGDRERTLAIMKDPRCGPAGVVALVLALLLKCAALASLPAAAWPALLLAPLLGRTALVALFLWLPYAREQGLGTALRTPPRGACGLALAATVLACLVAGREGWLALPAAAAVWLAWRRACLRRLGGFTGDVAGALVETTELAVLLAVALLVRS
jgi:adenosylcobinamide-GDP ribazoletransferase